MISFLQSQEWEVFQKSLKRKIWRKEGALFVQHQNRGFNYLYCPWPDIKNQDQFEKFLNEAEKIVKEEKSVFLKIDDPPEFKIPAKIKYSQSNSLQPAKTTVLDLEKSEKELLSDMHEKTRYNIRLAEKKGAVFKKETGDGIGARFWSILKETAERDRFYTHERAYYQKLIETKNDNFSNEIFFAHYQNRVVAAALVNFYAPSGIATYLHGASSGEHREVMAPHLMHWEIIKEAKNRGFKQYDFWGIDEKRWPGLTRFKLGFGGKVVGRSPAIDIIYRPPWYKIYSFIKILRGQI